MFGFNEVMNELGQHHPPRLQQQTLGASTNQRALKAFELRSNGPAVGQSALQAPPPTSAPANHRPGGAKTRRSANARAPPRRRLRQWARPGPKSNRAAGPAAGFESNVRVGAGGRPGGARANQRRRLAAPERWARRPRPALLFAASARPCEPDHNIRRAAAELRARARGGRPAPCR